MATEALLDHAHSRQLYELTGPRLMTFPDAVGEVAEEVKRPIQYLPITEQQFLSGLEDAGVPEPYRA